VLMSLIAAMLVLFASVAPASTVDLARWRCGENDVSPGPTGTFGQADDMAVDGTGNGHNLTNITPGGGPFYAYAGDYSGLGGLPTKPTVSTVDYAFAPEQTGGYYSLDTVPMGTQNWGMQVSVQCNDTAKELVFLQNGHAGTGATLFSIDGTALGWAPGVRYMAELPQVGIIDSGVTVDSAWHNLALVNDAGTTTFYMDGTATASVATGPSVAPGGYLGLGRSAGGYFMMVGGLDEARIFTFEQGAFTVSDLGMATPEPGTLVLLTTGLVGLLAYAWRKRK
jgi:hypothetical protein